MTSWILLLGQLLLLGIEVGAGLLLLILIGFLLIVAGAMVGLIRDLLGI